MATPTLCRLCDDMESAHLEDSDTLVINFHSGDTGTEWDMNVNESERWYDNYENLM